MANVIRAIDRRGEIAETRALQAFENTPVPMIFLYYSGNFLEHPTRLCTYTVTFDWRFLHDRLARDRCHASEPITQSYDALSPGKRETEAFEPCNHVNFSLPRSIPREGYRFSRPRYSAASRRRVARGGM